MSTMQRLKGEFIARRVLLKRRAKSSRRPVIAIYVEFNFSTAIGRNTTYNPARAVTNKNAFLIVDSSSSDTTTQGAHRWQLKAYIDDEGVVQIDKGTDGTTTGACSYWIVSCDEGEFEVETRQLTLSSAETSSTLNLNTPVDPLYTMVIGSRNMGGTVGTTLHHSAFCTFELTDSNTVTVTRGVTGTQSMETNIQVIQWATWTGVQVYHGTDLINTAIPNKTAYAHGAPDIDPEYTWLLTSTRHLTSGLEQCSVASSLLDGSGTGSSTNIYHQRYDQATAYTSYVSWFMVRFPNESIMIDNLPSDNSGTGTSQSIAATKLIEAAESVFTFTNSCNGTGNAFARPKWISIGFTTAGIYVLNALCNRGYSGQASEHDSQIVEIGKFRPQNPTAMLGPVA